MENKHVNRKADKLRNLTSDELKNQERDQMDQLFRLKFQMKMGQTESLTKIRALRRNVARLKTLSRQHALGIVPAASGTASSAKPKAAKPAAKAVAKPAAKKAVAKKGAAKKKSAKKSEKR